MDEIKELINNGDLEKRDETIPCPGCDHDAEFYQHKYDKEITAQYCRECDTGQWVEKRGQRSNPRRCSFCDEFVTDEQIENNQDIRCSNLDGFDHSCDQLAHITCAEFCEKCGWYCGAHISNQIECDNCGLYHDVNHFVSFGNDFVGTFGNICQDCFNEDEETYADEIDDDISRVGTPDDEELEAEKEIRKVYSKSIKETGKQVADFITKKTKSVVSLALTTFISERKRSDSSIYLSHFIRKKDLMNENDCLTTLIKILTDKKIEARPTGYFSVYKKIPSKTKISKAVCLTDGRISALKEHAENYSEFGIAFPKFKLLKNHKAAPAAYIHDSIIEKIKNQIPDELVPYVNKIKADGHNYHHEREWRVPADLCFDHDDVFAVFAPKGAHSELKKILPEAVQIICIDSIINL